MGSDAPSDPALILVGAGLANALIAQALSFARPDVPILLLESAAEPFGDHTWSFHQPDVSDADGVWLAPMIAHRWSGQTVRFTGFNRAFTTGYASLSSRSVAAALARLPNVTLRAGATVADLRPDGVTLADGTSIEAPCVIDGRGFTPDNALVLGHQKFVGLEVETEAPHGLALPVIMDATVDQKDGFRFVYLLPFSPTRILIEDTRYSDSDALSRDDLVADIKAYAATSGWAIREVVREEQGVLPITLAHDVDRYWAGRGEEVAQVGMRATLFHPTTGYSLPQAVHMASLIAARWPIGTRALAALVRETAIAMQRGQFFYRMLNRFLFLGGAPHERHLIMRRFYRLPQPLIERFYAGRLHLADMARILLGKPPIPVGRALALIRETPLFNR